MQVVVYSKVLKDKDMPHIQHHIAMCGCCKGEFDVLMTILEAELA